MLFSPGLCRASVPADMAGMRRATAGRPYSIGRPRGAGAGGFETRPYTLSPCDAVGLKPAPTPCFPAAQLASPRTRHDVARHDVHRRVLRRRLGHEQLRLDAVQPSGVAAQQLLLHLPGHAVFVHVVHGFPGVGGVVVRHVGRPQGDVLEDVPEPERDVLVALEGDEALPCEGLSRVGDVLRRDGLLAHKTVEVEVGLGLFQDQRQPARVGFQDGHPEPGKLLEPAGEQHHHHPGLGFADEAQGLGAGLHRAHAPHDVLHELSRRVHVHVVGGEGRALGAALALGAGRHPFSHGLGHSLSAGRKGVHAQGQAQLLELPPQGVELGERGVAVVDEDRADHRGLEAQLGHPPELLHRVVHVLDRQHGAGIEPLPVGGAIVVDPVVVRGGADPGGVGVLHQRHAHEGGREYHHLVDARRVHVLQADMGVALAGVAADLLVPSGIAGRDGAQDLLVHSGVPALSRIRVGLGVAVAHVAVHDHDEPVHVAVEVLLGECPLLLRNVLVPDFPWFVDVTVAVEDREVLGAPLCRIGHDRLLVPVALPCLSSRGAGAGGFETRPYTPVPSPGQRPGLKPRACTHVPGPGRGRV